MPTNIHIVNLLQCAAELHDSSCSSCGCAPPSEIMLWGVQGSPGVSPQQRYTARTSSGKTRTCNKCNKPFTTQGWPTGHPQQARLYVTVVEVSGQLYHPECVRCKACGKPITAMHVRHKDGLYHEKCHKKKFGITCNCCHERIEGEVRMLSTAVTLPSTV